ncbi:protein ACCELERATED CELL DEATH 6-like [Macadamia integrifolia]|uniref:protein ACCELERATED CELL DEATH 6-like n=1 Tax=Macadamia integrifolia TaxID=60698 RepID=UPI001C4FB413|nr:protein ACCELERATED CELL DEATH 6-like [Macadamia integrifolia]
MDPRVYEAAIIGDENALSMMESNLLLQVSPQGNTVAHIAASLRHYSILELLLQRCPSLLFKPNSKGNSPLHVAASADQLNIIKFLLECNSKDIERGDEGNQEQFLRMQNTNGNTVLHEAMENNHEEVAWTLVTEDPVMSHLVNNGGISPAYLAAEAGLLPLLEHMLGLMTDLTWMCIVSVGALEPEEEKKPYPNEVIDYYKDWVDTLMVVSTLILTITFTAGLTVPGGLKSDGRDESMAVMLRKTTFQVFMLSDTTTMYCAVIVVVCLLWAKIRDLQLILYTVNTFALPFLSISLLLMSIAFAAGVYLINKNVERTAYYHHLSDFLATTERERERERERAARMDAKLYAAVVAANINALSRMESDILQQVSPQKNTIAHIAASLGHYPVIELVYRRCPSLLYKQNSHGDTPLHVAARDGQLRIVKFFTDLHIRSKEVDEELDAVVEARESMRKRDVEENTPLHEAIQSICTIKRKEGTVEKHEEVSKMLVKADPGLSYLRNKEGSSPAYLAAETGLLQLLKLMLDLLHESSDLQEWQGAKTPLHAAIFRSHRESIKVVLKLKPQLIRVADEEGTTPLHYASFKGDLDGAKELLNMDISAAYLSDKIGYFPIHIAAHMGHIHIIQLFVELCPGSRELLTELKKENALRVAVNRGNENVIRYILKTPKLEKLLNEKQMEGNTPLHLATMAWLYKFVYILTSDGRVDLSLTNNDKLTALDIAETKASNEVSTFEKATTLIVLYNAGAPRAMNQHIIKELKQSKNHFQRRSAEYYSDFIDSLLVVSSLVLTVTFAAGFTMPGGFNGDSPNKGMATLLRKQLFKVFVIFDTIAMYLAVIAIISLIWARTGGVKLANTATNISLVFLATSLTMMSVAFTASVCVVTSEISWLSNVILVFSFIFLACMGILFLASAIPIWSRFGLQYMMSHYNLRKWLSAPTSGGK